MIHREEGLSVHRSFVTGGVEEEWRTHSIRQANVTVGMVRTAAVDLVWVAGLLHHHRAGLHRFWSAGQHHKQRTRLYCTLKASDNKVTDPEQREEVCVRQKA